MKSKVIPPTVYQIQATVCVTDPTGARTGRNLPTFFLNANVQGIGNARHAADIACDNLILGAISQTEFNRNDYRVSLTVMDCYTCAVENVEFHFPPARS